MFDFACVCITCYFYAYFLISYFLYILLKPLSHTIHKSNDTHKNSRNNSYTHIKIILFETNTFIPQSNTNYNSSYIMEKSLKYITCNIYHTYQLKYNRLVVVESYSLMNKINGKRILYESIYLHNGL